MAKRKGRKRVSKEQVKDNAARGGRGGNDWFDLPEGVERWAPEKPGRYNIDIVPYEVKTKNHPDDIEQGCLWYKLPFLVHHGVGSNNDSLVCPTSVGQQCPICDERNRLYKEDSDKNEEVINDLKPQKFVAYNILNPEDSEQIALLIMSRGKLAAPLEDELKDPDNEEHLAFFDVNEDGRTLRIRFSEATFAGKKYIEATKIDFKARAELDEDTILDATVCLEDALVVPPLDKLKSIFLQEEDEDADDDGDDNAPVPDPDEEEPDDNPADEEEEDGEDEEEEEAPELDEDACVACGGSGKNSRGKRCSPCKGTGKKQVEEEEEEEEEEPEPEPKPKKKTSKKKTAAKKKSDKPECPVEGGEFGQVDQYDECDDCPHWNACEEASD